MPTTTRSSSGDHRPFRQMGASREDSHKDRLIPKLPWERTPPPKGIALETAVFFLEFLNNADPRNVSDFEILMLLAMSHDAIPVYIPLKRKRAGTGRLSL